MDHLGCGDIRGPGTSEVVADGNEVIGRRRTHNRHGALQGGKRRGVERRYDGAPGEVGHHDREKMEGVVMHHVEVTRLNLPHHPQVGVEVIHEVGLEAGVVFPQRPALVRRKNIERGCTQVEGGVRAGQGKQRHPVPLFH